MTTFVFPSVHGEPRSYNATDDVNFLWKKKNENLIYGTGGSSSASATPRTFFSGRASVSPGDGRANEVTVKTVHCSDGENSRGNTSK